MQRYVILKNQVFRWEEKEPFTKSGKSVLGALEYDREKDAVKCHECGEWFYWISPTHLHRIHNINAQEYRERHALRVRTGLCSPTHSNRISAQTRRLREIGRIAPGFPSDKRGYGHHSPQRNEETRNETNACQAQTILCIQKIAADLGRTPSGAEAGSTVRQRANTHFGSWAAGCIAAGLEPNPNFYNGGVKYTDVVLRELIIDFYVLNRRLPRSPRDFGKGRLPSRGVYEARFGSLANLFDACGLNSVYEAELSGRTRRWRSTEAA